MIDTLYIYVLSAVCGLAILIYAIIRIPVFVFVRKLARRTPSDTPDEKLPLLSVVIVAHNEANQLEENLPKVLEQDYPAFEVIVVDDSSTDETQDVITRLMSKYNNLRHTFNPATARYVSRKKLAITLGVRAAKSNWLVLIEADAYPESNLWLRRIGEACSEEKNLVVGYANYEKESGLFADKARFDRMMSAMRFFSAVMPEERKRAVYGDISNLAFRKDVFLAHKGFSEHLTLLHGEELLIDTFAEKGRTTLMLLPDSIVRQTMPPLHSLWRTGRVFQEETLRHLSLRGKTLRIIWALSSVMLWIYWLSALALFAYDLLSQVYLWGCIALSLAFIVTVVMTALRTQARRSINEPSFLPLLFIYELFMPLRSFHFKTLRFFRRRDFRRKE